MGRKLLLQPPTTLCAFSATFFLIKNVCNLTDIRNDGQNEKKNSNVRETRSKYKHAIDRTWQLDVMNNLGRMGSKTEIWESCGRNKSWRQK